MRLPETRDEVIGNILTYDDAIRNINRYQPDVRNSLIQTMTRAMGWIFIQHNGLYRAGPLKFCGAQINMTPERYHANAQKLDGTQASGRIGEIFFEDDDWEDYELEEPHRAIRALRAIAQGFGKDLKATTRYYILPGENIDDTERAKVERLVQAVARESLSATARKAFLARLA
jgi:hypothetical protein